MTTTASESQTGRGTKKAASARRTAAGRKQTGSPRKAREDASRQKPAEGARAAGGQRHTTRVNLPGVSAEFRIPQLRMPRVPTPRQVVRAAGSATNYLPSRDRLLLYGGLGTAAVIGVIEWPVAIAVGAGVAVAQRSRQEGTGRSDRTSRRTERTETS
jgi:hypothetical protein